MDKNQGTLVDERTVKAPKARKLSPSSISTFKQCPRKWEFRYIKKIREMPGMEAVLGNFVHTVLENLMQLPSQDRTQENAKKIAREKYDSETTPKKEYQNLKLPEQEALNFRKTAWKLIEGIWDLEDPTQVNVHSTELEINTKLGDVDFRSFIDRVDKTADGFVIVDYKSGKFPTSESLKEEKLEQLRLYAAAFEASEGTRPKEVRLYFPNPPNKDRGDQISELIDEEIIENTLKNLNEVHIEIKSKTETENFPAKAGPLCGWCSYIRDCDSGTERIQKLHREGRVRSDAPAVELLELISS